MLSASPRSTPPPTSPSPAVLDSEAQSVAHLFRDRVAASPDRQAYRTPWVASPVRVGHRHLVRARRVVREIGAGLVALGVEPEDRVAIASPPATSGPWPTSPSCAPAGRPRRSTRRRSPPTWPSSWPTPAAKVVFAENAEQVEKLRERRDELPGAPPRRHLRRRVRRGLRGSSTLTSCASWAASSSPATRGRRRAHRRAQARPARHDHLHLGHHRPAQGRAAAPRRLDLRGRRRRRRSASSPRTTCSTSGCRSRTCSARCC